jgi:S-formylglutathione hydrolase
MRPIHRALVCALLPVLVPHAIEAQPAPPTGSIVRELVHSPALEGNLLGDPADQPVATYLPPGYTETSRRYPVLYLLHGIGDSPDVWVGPGYQGMEIRAVMDSLIGAGGIQPMIVVMPNGTNRYIGTFYMNSPVAGGWEDFIARDLVEYVDGTFRTLGRRASRGVAGHSMGGYGSILMGMRHHDVFSSIWAMNPCCLAMLEDISLDNPAWRRAAEIRTQEDIDAALAAREFYPVAIIALASVLSPRPDLPPLYVELPYRAVNGEPQPIEPIYMRWQSAFPVAVARKHREALASLEGLRLDTVFEDEYLHIPPGTQMLADTLASLGVPHVFEMYEGDHRNRMRERLTTLVLPWFSEILEGEP